MSKRALVATLCAVLFVLAPRLAEAAGTLYLAKGDDHAGSELPLDRTDVEIDVAGSIVGATVTQRFKNPYERPIEVVYAFPLPQRAAVDAMEMKIGTRTITGSIARREDAQAAYAAAVSEGRRAALLEQERPNLFTFSVGNIDAGATIDVKLHYFEVAAFDHGTYEIAVPTTIGPRFIPASGVADARRITPPLEHGTGAKIGIHARVDGGTALESVTTPSWDTEVTTKGSIADVRLKTDREVPNRDFVLRWRLKADSFEPALFTHRESEDASGYLTLMLEPKHDLVPSEIAPRELVFLLDTSGSMHGPPLAAAVMAIHKALDKLGPADTFQIIDFADSASAFAPRPLPSTLANKKRGHEYISHLEASGGTNQLAGIHAALSMPRDESRARYVVFMTDGFIGNDESVIALTRKEIGQAHIFSFGVGSSVNRYLLDEVAIAGRGYAEYMRAAAPDHSADDDTTELVDRFYDRIGMPFLTDIQIDWNGLAVSDARPAALPDLSALEPLVLHARYARAGEGDVTIRGKVGGKTRSQKIHVVLPAIEPGHAAIEKLWARATIADMERVGYHKHPDELAITKLAVAHGLLSKYTAFVGTDSTGPHGATGAPALIRQPNESPADVGYGEAAATTYASAEREPAMSDVAPRRGGCAGCAASRGGSSSALAALCVLVAVLLVRRRRGLNCQ